MKMAQHTAKLLKNVPLPDEISHVHDNAVIIDNGSATIKAGFSGDDFPRCVLPTPQGAVKRGIVQDWDTMERLWETVYTSKLKISASDAGTPVLLTEPALTPRDHRVKMCEILFEKFKVPSLYVSISPVLGMYASGRTTGMVVECGNMTCHTVPIFEGFSLYHSILQQDYGGMELTSYLQRVLQDKDVRLDRHHRYKVCEYLKESLCGVAANAVAAASTKTTATHRLPDGTEITLGSERFMCCEALFQPQILNLIGVRADRGLHTTAAESVRKCDADLTSLLYGNVVLTGGSSMFNGLQDRLAKELAEVAPSEKVKIYAQSDRKRTTWMGGSILASLPTFQKFWITRAEWDENPHVVHRNCF